MTSTPLDATLSISGSAPGQPIRREIFGYFIEHFHRLIYGGIYDPASPLSDDRGFRTDVIEALRELTVPIVRWPGGCFVSSYDWLDAVGPERISTFDKAWRVDDPNTFGTAEFVEWCTLVGAAPYICTNAGTGTSEEMADWLEYCNQAGSGRWAALRRAHGFAEPFAVPFWSIGNENYGTWEMGAKGPAEWARFVTESAKMMRRVDPSVQLLTAARPALDWTLPLLEAAGPYLDSVAIHGYWDALWVVDEPDDYLTCISRSLEPEADIRRMRSIIEAAGYAGKISIAFDEWNLRGWHHPPGNDAEALAARNRNDRHETYTMADALFSASFLNSCIRNADVVTMANLAPLVNGRGPLFADEDGIVKRTTFHAMSLYANLLGSDFVESTSHSVSLDCGGEASVPVVDSVATRNAEGRLVVALVNRHPDVAARCRIDAGGSLIEGTIAAQVLSGDSVDAFNSPADPIRVTPESIDLDVTDGVVTLAAHSLTIVTLPGVHEVPEALAGWSRVPGAGWRADAAASARASGPRVDWSF